MPYVLKSILKTRRKIVPNIKIDAKHFFLKLSNKYKYHLLIFLKQ